MCELMKDLFSPFEYKGLTLKNRIVMPPMCQYSVVDKDGTPNAWHDTHYISRAVGGSSLIIMEMTNVEPDGRISDQCLGFWSDDQIPAYKRIIDAVHSYDAKIGIQIAHAGRKAEDADQPVAPSTIRFDENYKEPRALTTEEVKEMVEKFRLAVRRSVKAGVDTIELHGAHGYLIHQFHSEYTNKRTDEYGELSKFGVEVIRAAKEEMPADMPLIMRISAVEFVENGYEIDYGIKIAKAYKDAGVDIFHISAGGEGAIAPAKHPGGHAAYLVPYARSIKEAVDVPVIAVGNLDDPKVADATISNNDADLVAVGRGMLRDPYWAISAGIELGKQAPIPEQYLRGF